MNRLYIIVAIMLCAVSLQAASLYYQFPDATVFHNDDRMLIHQNISGVGYRNSTTNRNLTGSGLKSIIHQTAWNDAYPKVFGTVTSSTIPLQIVHALRNQRGVITHLQWENGYYFTGVPGYNHTYVYPFNNMTNVSRTTPLVIGSRWITRGFVGKQISIPGGPAFTPKALKYMGLINGRPNFDFINPDVDQTTQDAFFWGINSVGTLAANTTYTIRSAMAQAWDSTGAQLHGIGNNPCSYQFANTSSAKVMDNYSTNLCRSTFRTGS